MSTATRSTNYALYFNGTDEYTTLGPTDGSLNITGDNLTISLWFTLDTPSYGYTGWMISKMGTSNGAWGFYYNTNNPGDPNHSKFSLPFKATGGSWTDHRTTVQVALTAGQWYHIATVYNGSDIKFYLNGSQLGAAVAKSGNIDGATGFKTAKLGWEDGWNSQRFAGKMDEVAVWTSVLSNEEISDLYNGGSGLYINSTSTFPTCGTSMGTNLEGLWHFSEGIGLSATDASGNNNTGYLQNMDNTNWVEGKVPFYETLADKRTYIYD